MYNRILKHFCENCNMIHFNGKSYYIKKFKYFENLLKILDDSISKMPTNITFVYNDKVIKVFLHKKYFVRYLYNYENFTNYNKITIKKGVKNDVYYIEMPYIKNNNIFDIKYININYNVSRFKDIQVINSLNNLSISNKGIKNLYDFFKVFLCYLKKTNLNIDLKVLKKTFLFLEKYKEIFISDENLYFIHGDFTSDNFIINKSKIYVIDFSNSGYFDFYYDICCFINFDKNKDKILLSDIKLIFKKNGIEFNTIRYRFNQLLYDLMD